MTKKIQIIITCTVSALAVVLFVFVARNIINDNSLQEVPRDHLFYIQSIDTMKYSRDMARVSLTPSFLKEIDSEMSLIQKTGATHVAIDTPYDTEFLPTLRAWVDAARAHNLSVWFRGNFSGWEKWFNYSPITRQEHEQLLATFISSNPDLFENGDIFTPCPECENGGPGDPRQTGDVAGYQKFLADEYTISNKEFSLIGKSVSVYFSMNGDIAKYVMTPKSVQAIGGTILVDHYVSSPEQFSTDIPSFRSTTKGSVGIGEFGAPIPDLNGNLTDKQQADFVYASLNRLANTGEILPIVNYWVLKGGGTAILKDNGQTLPVYDVIKDYFSTPSIYGNILDQNGNPVVGVNVIATASSSDMTMSASSSKNGFYQIFLPKAFRTVTFTKDGYQTVIKNIPDTFSNSVVTGIVMNVEQTSFVSRLKNLILKIRQEI